MDHINKNPKLKEAARKARLKQLDEELGPELSARPSVVVPKDWTEATPHSRRVMAKNLQSARSVPEDPKKVRALYMKGLERLFVPEAAHVHIGGAGDQAGHRRGQWKGHIILTAEEAKNVRSIVSNRNDFDKKSLAGLRGDNAQKPIDVG